MKVAASCVFAIASIAACSGDHEPNAGVCTDRPCRTTIETEQQWAAVSTDHTGPRCDFAQETKYIAPASAAAALQEVVFHDVKTHRLHFAFMTQVLTEYFGGMAPQTYRTLVQLRATRQYWAGAIFQLRDPDGAITGYGFDVIVDRTIPDEELTEAEIEAIGSLLATEFRLPLTYAPTTDEAIERARRFTRITSHFPRACGQVQCTKPNTDCFIVPEPVSLCGQFIEDRTIQTEHARKATLAVMPGVYEIDGTPGSYTIPALFGAGTLGPQEVPLVPAGTTGTYEITAGGFGQRTYRQLFDAGGEPYELSWSVRSDGGGVPIAEPQIQGRIEPLLGPVGTSDNNEIALLTSCHAPNLEAWQIRGELPDGDGFVIDVRYEVPLAGSGPLLVTGAEVTLGGQTTVVDDYFRLVYAGEHHNWNNQYWVLFDAPVAYAGHSVYGLWLDETELSEGLEAAWTLDASQQPLDAISVSAYRMEQVP
ncbi:MAG: hypothetical protein AB7O24_15445 [Kofleriaceae bacterium]